jgi:hypothetical protein
MLSPSRCLRIAGRAIAMFSRRRQEVLTPLAERPSRRRPYQREALTPLAVVPREDLAPPAAMPSRGPRAAANHRSPGGSPAAGPKSTRHAPLLSVMRETEEVMTPWEGREGSGGSRRGEHGAGRRVRPRSGQLREWGRGVGSTGSERHWAGSEQGRRMSGWVDEGWGWGLTLERVRTNESAAFEGVGSVTWHLCRVPKKNT